MDQKSISERQGFTLIELMITIGILGIAIIPMMSVYVATWQATMQAERRNHATMLARQQMSLIKGKKSYNELSGTYSNSFDPPYNTFSYTIKVEDIGGGTNSVYQAKLLKSRIIYQSVYGGERTISCPDLDTCGDDAASGNIWDYSQIVSPTHK